MQKILLGLLFMTFSVWSAAQISISVAPGTITGSGLPTSPDIAAYCHITNNSSVPISLLWSRSVVSAPQEWASWICDMNNCYLPHVSSCPENRPNTIDPGQSFELSVHVGPAGVEGEAELKLYFFDLSDQQVFLDSVQVFFETSTTSVNELSNSSLRIYPNPTTSYFQLSDPTKISTVIVHTMVGNKIRQFDARQGNRFDVADLPEGIYLVRLLDAGQNVLKTVRLSKR